MKGGPKTGQHRDQTMIGGGGESKSVDGNWKKWCPMWGVSHGKEGRRKKK